MEAAIDPRPPPRRRRRKRQKGTRDYTNTAATTISELPDHIRSNIISRLPLKSIFTCKRVCSSFRSLTLDPYFPQLHLPMSPLSLILYRHCSSYSHHPTFGFLSLADSLVDLGLPRSTMKFETKIEIPACSTLRMKSSCNGLICLSNYYCSDEVCICNPITRQHLFLPKPKNKHVWSGYGIGYSQSTHHFKVVKFTVEGELPHRLQCWVYTLGVDDEWRSLGDTGQPVPDNGSFVLLNGALHWIGLQDSELLLCYFDMEKEQCGNLPLPNLSFMPCQLKGTRFHLGVVDFCLYIRDEQKCRLPVNIWVMKDYKNIGSWSLEWIIQRPIPSWVGLDLKPLKTLEDGAVLMIVKQKTLVSYNPVTTIFERVRYHGVHSWEEAIADVPSFLPLPGAE
ncbi:hypothetical protein Vadar_005564 [Vaccinium darrowii]|uniref:Uncharacterized protein n=1 Tax=Vaccinium darrowii TaxID=229202 RepID=A0ACB7XP79_9ERIC|nr:hypothetical protein Vadar_005564 [Vaccinium darrowii]